MATTKLTGGHTSSVLCLATQVQTGQVVSGAENGDLCLWSNEGQLVTKLTRPDSECTSVIFSKENPNLVYAAFGEEVLLLDMTRSQDPVFTFQSNQDEVNQLDLDTKEQFLAACDDSGEIKVYGLQDRKVFKTLRYKHTNICSAVTFRPGKQWELISCGLDSRLVHWDFSKPKCLNQFNMQELFPTPGDSTHMVNPPFIHHISASPTGSTFACALENGQLPVFDGSHKNLRPKHALLAHNQGVSQVHFIDEDNVLSAGNDSCIVHWDLSKSELYQPEGAAANGHMNGHSNGHCGDGRLTPEEEKMSAITELCRVRTFTHPHKVNWMSVRVSETDKKVFIADHTPDISILDL